MRKYNLARLPLNAQHDDYVKHSVMVFGDEGNVWNGRVLDRCSINFDAILINLGAEEEIKQHRHDGSEEMVLVLSGSGQISQAGKSESLKVNDLVYLEKSTPHAFRAGEMGLKFLQVHCPPMHDRTQD